MDKVRAIQKAGRSLHKRGPQAAGSARRARAPTLKADVHFSASSGNDEYFRATRAIVTTARGWRKLANERVSVIGQTMARWETLFLVAFSDYGLTQGELARLISVEGPTVVRMLDLLAKKGMIVRRQSAADRRVTTNRITAKGMREISNIMAITDELREKILGNVEPQRLAICIEVLHEILRNIGALKVSK